MSELTPRQWALYNYLKRRNCWEKQELIAEDLADEYNWFPQNYPAVMSFHDSKARADMTEDIRTINKSDVIQKIIIVSSKGVKLASEEEAERFIKAKYSAIFRRLARARKLERKAGLDGQFKLVFGSEREVIQAFTDSNVTGDKLKNSRKLAKLSQKQAVELLRKFINIDEPMLSKIENGVCLPNSEQVAAFEKVYSHSDIL